MRDRGTIFRGFARKASSVVSDHTSPPAPAFLIAGE